MTYTSPSSKGQTEELRSKINGFNNGAKAVHVQADLRHIEAPAQVVSAAQAAFGDSVDILVNNAGVEMHKPILETSLDDYNAIMDLNLRAVFLMCKAVMPHLRAPGRIINVSSVGARMNLEGFSIYSASKAGLEAFTRNLAMEIGGSGHTANAVEPGPVKSDMYDKLPKDLVSWQESRTAVERRAGVPEDIGMAVSLLCEDRARWISGQTISLSGGFQML